MGRFYHIAVKVFYKSSADLFHIYKGVFTPSNFLSMVKRNGNISILSQNEEMLLSKNSVSFFLHWGSL